MLLSFTSDDVIREAWSLLDTGAAPLLIVALLALAYRFLAGAIGALEARGKLPPHVARLIQRASWRLRRRTRRGDRARPLRPDEQRLDIAFRRDGADRRGIRGHVERAEQYVLLAAAIDRAAVPRGRHGGDRQPDFARPERPGTS